VTAEDVLGILARLDRGGIRWWVHGGWGMDALLGEETRPHDDLDLAVARDDVPRLETTLSEFRRVPERDEWPASFVIADPSGRHIDIHPLRLDEQGNGWQERGDKENLWSRYDLSALGRIAGTDVRCLSPEFEARSHLYPGHDDIDRRDHASLAERFGFEQLSEPLPGRIHPKRVRARPPGL
jgi:lincosamide nucleotidyltransferase A/C/D/E